MKNYWIVGDIHGDIKQLDRLLEQIMRSDPELVVFVGDYIDRGPHSKLVIDRLIQLGDRAVCLMGNHEMMMLNALEGMGLGHSPVEQWYYNGGEATIMSFGHSSFFSFQSDLDPAYLEFFRHLKMSHYIEPLPGRKIFVSHAGISPFIPIADQKAMTGYEDLRSYLLKKQVEMEDSFLWVREAFFNASPELWEGYLVVHGHTPVMKLQRFASTNAPGKFIFAERDLCFRKHLVNGGVVSVDIDSGSVVSGRLSGIGFFIEEEGPESPVLRMRSITVSSEELIPRDLGLYT